MNKIVLPWSHWYETPSNCGDRLLQRLARKDIIGSILFAVAEEETGIWIVLGYYVVNKTRVIQTHSTKEEAMAEVDRQLQEEGYVIVDQLSSFI